MILMITCFVKTLGAPLRLGDFSTFARDVARDDGIRGEPSAVRYPGGSSSSSNGRASSALGFPDLSFTGASTGWRRRPLRIHRPISRPGSLRYLRSS